MRLADVEQTIEAFELDEEETAELYDELELRAIEVRDPRGEAPLTTTYARP